MKKLDYIIVGQGIAGTLLAWFLDKANQQFVVIDEGHTHSSTKIAAGIINPITGRRFVKSWMIEQLLPFAKQTYQAIEQETGRNFWEDKDIIRYFLTTAEANNWLTKTGYEGYGQYLSTEPIKEELIGVMKDTEGYGVVKGARVSVGKVIAYFKQHLSQRNQLREQIFDYEKLEILDSGVRYEELYAKKLIFCEGFSAAQNPWFANLPYESAKGEVLILKIPHLKTDYILKKTQFLVPLEEDLFWFGSNYEWEDLTFSPTQEGRKHLEERLRDILHLKVEIVEHLAAVRPILKDRRPVLGLHPSLPTIGIFNGLGTKGTSIAPFWADQFVRYLLEEKEIPEEVSVERFF